VRSNSNTIFTTLKNTNVDYIAVAITPWHAIGIDAFLFKKAKEYNRRINGIIIILPNNNKYVVHENNFSCDSFTDVNFYYIENLSYQKFTSIFNNLIGEGFNILKGIKNSRNSKNNEKRLYLISPWTPYLPFIEYFKDKEIASKYKPIFVVIDEGVGIYVNKKSNELGIKHASKFSILAEIKLKSYDYADRLLRKISLRYVPLEKKFVFEHGSSMKRNEDTINLYKKIIEIRSNDLGLHEDNVALLVTQPLSEYKMVSKQHECDIIQEIIQLFKENKVKVVIKPHPSETKNKYDYLKNNNVKIINNNFPVEEIIPNLNPICVIGTLSTALINSKVLFNITSVSIVNLLKTDNDLMEYTIQDFKKLSTNFIIFVDSSDEIIKMLDLNSNKDKNPS